MYKSEFASASTWLLHRSLRQGLIFESFYEFLMNTSTCSNNGSRANTKHSVESAGEDLCSGATGSQNLIAGALPERDGDGSHASGGWKRFLMVRVVITRGPMWRRCCGR